MTRSPVDEHVELGGGARSAATLLASARRPSVVLPSRSTTTTTSFPARLAATDWLSDLPDTSTSATDEPPYFWTMTAISNLKRSGTAYHVPAIAGKNI